MKYSCISIFILIIIMVKGIEKTKKTKPLLHQLNFKPSNKKLSEKFERKDNIS